MRRYTRRFPVAHRRRIHGYAAMHTELHIKYAKEMNMKDA